MSIQSNFFSKWIATFSPPGNDLEPGLPGAGDKEPRTDHQPPHRRGTVHVFQHRWQPPRHHLQGQESPADGASLRKPVAGTVLLCACVLVVYLRGQNITCAGCTLLLTHWQLG